VTDHRIGFSVKNVEGIMEGEALIEMLDKLKEWREKEALELLLEEGEEAEEGNTGGKE
jgi:protein subunit release factor A